MIKFNSKVLHVTKHLILNTRIFITIIILFKFSRWFQATISWAFLTLIGPWNQHTPDLNQPTNQPKIDIQPKRKMLTPRCLLDSESREGNKEESIGLYDYNQPRLQSRFLQQEAFWNRIIRLPHLRIKRLDKKPNPSAISNIIQWLTQ